MTVPLHELLERVQEVGASLSVNGNKLRVRTTAPMPDELVEELRRAKPALLTYLRGSMAPDPGPGADAQIWRDWYGERAAIREHDAHYTRAEAERLAFNECVCRWHLINGKAPDTRYCAGCGNVTDNRKTMQLPDGAVVHSDPEHKCLRAYGDKWRGTAKAALAAFGLVKTSP